MTAAIDRLFKLMCERGSVRPAPVRRHAAARFAKTARFRSLDLAAPPLDLGDDDLAARADHAGEEQRGVRAPARHRLRLRDRRAGAVPRERLHGPEGPGRGLPRDPVEDPDGRAISGLSPHILAAVSLEQRARARDRADRLGQVHDAVRDDRLHQPEPQRSHHHHRRPDRVRAREPEVPGQPARGRTRTPIRSSDALRAALREDPDIVLVGEMRDLETVAIAIETAETGHLVFGTLHTTTAASTVDRIIDQFPPDRQAQIRMMLSESLRGVIAQTLCKKIGGGRVAALEVLIVTRPSAT